MKKRYLRIFARYIIYFVIFALMGSLIEYIFGFAGGTGIAYDKLLYRLFNIKIFFIPFYGFVGLNLIFLDRFLEKKKVKIFFIGILNGILIVFWELIAGMSSIIFLGHRVWDYSSHLLNFYGVISLQMFLLWVMVGYLFILVYKYIIKNIDNLSFLKSN